MATKAVAPLQRWVWIISIVTMSLGGVIAVIDLSTKTKGVIAARREATERAQRRFIVRVVRDSLKCCTP